MKMINIDKQNRIIAWTDSYHKHPVYWFNKGFSAEEYCEARWQELIDNDITDMIQYINFISNSRSKYQSPYVYKPIPEELQKHMNKENKMTKGVALGDVVKIIPHTGDEFENDRIGVVTNVDGSYILVKRNISGVECELYPLELELIKRASK